MLNSDRYINYKHKLKLNGMKKYLFVFGILIFITNSSYSQTIHDEIKNGNFNNLKSLIEKDPELLIKKYKIETPVNWMPEEISPLFDAVLYGRYDIIEYLIEKGVDLKKDNYVLFLAVLQKGKKIKQLLIENGARITNDTAPHMRFNILTKAVSFYRDNLSLCKQLIDLGAEVNLDWGKDGNYTHAPLGMATRRMLPEIVKLLVENGAKMNLSRNNGQIGLHDAIFYNNTNNSKLKYGYSSEILNYFLKHGGDKSHKDNNGDIPLEYASITGTTAALKILWDGNYDVKQTNFDGMTLLHRTVIYGYYDCVKFLTSKGFDLKVKDYYGNTPLFYAYQYGHDKIVDFLLSKGCTTKRKPNLPDIETILDIELTEGQAYVWYLGRYSWVIKTKNNLIFKLDDWGEFDPDNPSLKNGNIIPEELIGQNILMFGSENDALKLVSKNAFLKTKYDETNVYLFSRKTSLSNHITTVNVKPMEVSNVNNVKIKKDDSGNLLIISDGVKIFHIGYKDPDGKFLDEIKNSDLVFFDIWGSKGELSEEHIQEAEERIELYKPKTMFHHSLYTRSYFFQELSKQLKKSGCKVEVPVAKYPGDMYFYDAKLILK